MSLSGGRDVQCVRMCSLVNLLLSTTKKCLYKWRVRNRFHFSNQLLLCGKIKKKAKNKKKNWKFRSAVLFFHRARGKFFWKQFLMRTLNPNDHATLFFASKLCVSIRKKWNKSESLNYGFRLFAWLIRNSCFLRMYSIFRH